VLNIRKLLFYIVLFLGLIIVLPIKEPDFMTHIQQQARTKVDAWTNNNNTANNELKVPSKQEFALNNIQMNMTKEQVESKIGKAQRITTNEYGTKWYSYHTKDYHDFVMVSYIDNKVNGLYTNQNLISSQSQIKYGSPKNVVRQRLGKPITEKRKGNVLYQIDNKEYDTFKKHNIYTTAFYDKHNNNNLTSLLLVSNQMENRLRSQYGAPSDDLQKSFELQNFDLVNAERVQHNLSTLTYNATISNIARKHSKDMAKQNYFDHTDLNGNSPFDRLKSDNIDFNAAGENLAYGQVDSIYAHEGLMNSLGHRKNILRPSYNKLGVGVAFNSDKQPYWTENYTN
jgi:uncharacterized protein YkwD